MVGKPVSDTEREGEDLVSEGALGVILARIRLGRWLVQFKKGDKSVFACDDWQWIVDEDRLTLIDDNHSADAGKTARPQAAPDGSTTEKIVDQLRSRHHAGLKRYGATVDRNDLEPLEWVQHFREELLDALAYLQRIEDKLNEK